MRFTIAGLVLVLAVGCSSEEPGETRSEGARDTAIAESAIPGAAGVRSALSVADSANARRAREDSIMAADEQ